MAVVKISSWHVERQARNAATCSLEDDCVRPFAAVGCKVRREFKPLELVRCQVGWVSELKALS